MAKKQSTNVRTGRVIACRFDPETAYFLIRVIFHGSKVIRVGVSPYRQRIGDVVVLAGDDLDV